MAIQNESDFPPCCVHLTIRLRVRRESLTRERFCLRDWPRKAPSRTCGVGPGSFRLGGSPVLRPVGNESANRPLDLWARDVALINYLAKLHSHAGTGLRPGAFRACAVGIGVCRLAVRVELK